MEEGELLLAILAWTLMAFTLGALITWRLEGRRPLVQPFWLLIVRNVSFVAMAASVVVTSEPPSRIVTIDPLWWTAMEIVILGGALTVFVLEVRHHLRNRQAA
jgi:hypothetical protein